MIGVLVELLLSWLLLHFLEHRSLSALGFRPTRRRLSYSGAGLLISMVFFSLFFLSGSFLDHNPYRINPALTGKSLLVLLRDVTTSVIFEELLFRGALLYILIRRIGPRRGVLLSAITFGIYHWFTYKAFGQPMAMAYIFLITGLAGYAFARAFEKTGAILLPFALHFGTDFTRMVLFEQNPGASQHILIKQLVQNPVTTSAASVALGLLVLINLLGYPLLVLLWLRSIRRDT